MKFKKHEVRREFDLIMKELGLPDILLVNPREFQSITNASVDRRCCGTSSVQKRVIWVNNNQTNLIELRDTVWHEILHLFFPYSTEWWIECCAYRLSHNTAENFGYYAYIKSKTPRDVPSRNLLIKMILAAIEGSG